MSKLKTIDSQRILDATEAVLCQQGLSALSIGNVAQKASISKGGVQSRFGTREALIRALYQRGIACYEKLVSKLTKTDDDPLSALRAHILAASGEQDTCGRQRATSMLAVLVDPQDLRQRSTLWLRERLQSIDPQTEEGRQARLAFFASEGALMLHHFGLMEMTESEWQGIFADILGLLDESSPGSGTSTL